ncbi:MAG: hypothetical protein HY675_03825 [Chloroflexi bacterium]|nr:hypothetical protein [Chloroflexota bacterium]
MSEVAHRQRVATNLNCAQVELLDRIAREAKFSGGAKLSHSLILDTLVEVLGQLQIDVSGVRSKDDLQYRIVEAIRSFS